MQYFVSEGVAAGQKVLIASAEHDPARFVKGVYAQVPARGSANPPPGPAVTHGNGPGAAAGDSSARMEIAWRYSARSKVVSELGSGAAAGYCHPFDLSKQAGDVPAGMVEAIDCRDHGPAVGAGAGSDDAESAYERLFSTIAVAAAPYAASAAPPAGGRRAVLRIVIHCIGSPYWESSDGHRSMLQFLARLRGLLRTTYAVLILNCSALSLYCVMVCAVVFIPAGDSNSPLSSVRFQVLLVHVA